MKLYESTTQVIVTNPTTRELIIKGCGTHFIIQSISEATVTLQISDKLSQMGVITIPVTSFKAFLDLELFNVMEA